MKSNLSLLVCSLFLLFPFGSAPADEISDTLAVFQKIGPEGAGNAEAAGAWKSLSQLDSSAILPILTAMEGSSPLARNWLRSATEVIFEKEVKAGSPIPKDEIKTFLLEKKNDPNARKLAFDLFGKVAPDAARELIPGMLNDPSTSLRREAVALLIEEGKSKIESEEKAAAETVLSKALDSARDIDQIKEIDKLLREKLEKEVDLPKHFGFLMYWHVIGPFDNTERKGFAEVFSPGKGNRPFREIRRQKR